MDIKEQLAQSYREALQSGATVSQDTFVQVASQVESAINTSTQINHSIERVVDECRKIAENQLDNNDIFFNNQTHEDTSEFICEDDRLDSYSNL